MQPVITLIRQTCKERYCIYNNICSSFPITVYNYSDKEIKDIDILFVNYTLMNPEVESRLSKQINYAIKNTKYSDICIAFANIINIDLKLLPPFDECKSNFINIITELKNKHNLKAIITMGKYAFDSLYSTYDYIPFEKSIGNVYSLSHDLKTISLIPKGISLIPTHSNMYLYYNKIDWNPDQLHDKDIQTINAIKKAIDISRNSYIDIWENFKCNQIESTNINKIGFNDSNNTLRIEFKNCNIYDYLEVPNTIYESFLQAESKGNFFYKYVKSKFEFKKVN
jgi:hypothetical protein